MPSLERYDIDYAVRQERFYRDTAQWDQLRAMWHPDATETLVNISCIDDWVDGCKQLHAAGSIGAFHSMQPAEIVIKGDRAVATTVICIHARTVVKGSDVNLESWAHQIQRLVKVNGRWAFVRFEVIYLRDSILAPTLGQSAPQLDEALLKVLRDARPSYKYLTLQMAIAGRAVRDDLPGYDDEKTWRPMVTRNLAWLDEESV